MTRKFLFTLTRHHRRFSVSALRRNEEFIVRSSQPDVVIPQMRFLDRLWINAAGFQNHVALECAETKKQYTYMQLQRNTAAFGTSLVRKLGLKQGDVLAAMLPNCPEFAVVALGAIQAGIILTTVNPVYKEFEVCHMATTTAPKVVVTIPECYDTVIKGLKEAKINARIVLIDKPNKAMPDGAIRYTEIAESGDVDYSLLDKIEKKLDDVAIIPFSSGTMGLPKGVDITYGNLMAGLEMMGRPENCFPKITQGSFQDVVPCILPFFHIYGLIVTLFGHLVQGCKLTTMTKFSASLFFDILSKQDVTLLYIVPPIAILLGKHPDVKQEFFQSMRHIVCGAAPLAASDAEAVLQKSKKDIEFNQGFGATETTSLVTSTFIGTRDIDYSASGVPMASIQMKFVDPISGNDVPIGQSGELYVRGPTIMKGYHGSESATRESLAPGGWFRTGDLGHYAPGRGLYITDRIKELIKVKGMQVAPAELESVLRAHPGVADAAVLGVPHVDRALGEAPRAFVVRRKDSLSEDELKRFVADKVAPFKQIDKVVFVDDIPKTASGKILRKELKKMYA